MGFVGDFIGDVFGGGGEDAAEAASYASDTQARFQKEALDYLKERESLPIEISEGALPMLAGLSGIPGFESGQEEMIQRAIDSPLYKRIMGGREAGEEAILRSAGATGGLRSGDVQSNLYDYNVQLENKALLESYNQQLQGLTGLAGLPSMAPQIAQQTAGIGQTYAQGITAKEQGFQTAKQQGMQNLIGLGSLGVAMFSDRRLKENIVKIGEVGGHNWYLWDWNRVANKMGLDGQSEGVLADEVFEYRPDVILMKDGFLMVNYTALGIFKEEVAS